MRNRARLLLLVLGSVVCVACAGGEIGDEGPTGDPGPQGSPGPQGTQGPGLVWKDSLGVTVPRSYPANSFVSPMGLIDDSGRQWVVNIETGVAMTVATVATSFQLFTSTDCTGAGYRYVTNLPPRAAFIYGGATSPIKVRGDSPAATNVAYNSFLSGASCSATTGTLPGLPTAALDALPTVTPPMLTGFTAPFHQEAVGF